MKKLHVKFDCVVTDKNAEELLNASDVVLEEIFETALEAFDKGEYVANVKVCSVESRRTSVSYKIEYAYTEAVVVEVSQAPFCQRKYNVKYLDSNIQHRVGFNDITLDRKIFKASTAPQVGDVVKLRDRITRHNPMGFGGFAKPIICEVIKRSAMLNV